MAPSPDREPPSGSFSSGSALTGSVPSGNNVERRVAAIDIGTNSTHLLIAAIDPALHSFRVLLAEKSTTRLGDRDPESGAITPEALERGFQALRHFRDLADSHGVEQIVTGATSAAREAPNGREFLLTLQERLGLEVDLISGPEEARLIYLGVLSAMPLGETAHTILDIGGGSTELILADGADGRAFTSTRIGAVRLQREFCAEDPLPPATRSFLEAYIRGALDPAVAEVKRALKPGERPTMVATSGTAMTLAALAAAEDPRPPLKLQGYRIRRERLEALVARLQGLSLEQRRALPAMNERRAEIIVPGALILQTAMAMLKADELVVCDRALREGLIVDWMLRNDLLGDRFAFQSTIRERAVLHLARNYGVDPERAERVAGHALSLYDQSRGVLHDDAGPGRHLLWAAARLHVCGKHINIGAYHKHTWYLIRHGELLGHSQNEHLMVAAIARYHRRSLPKKRHESWQLIEGREPRRIVQSMALLLRLAAALDRRPAGLIAALKVGVDGSPSRPDAVVIDLVPTPSAPDEPPVDLTLERWSLRACAPVVLELTGLPLRVPGLTADPAEAVAGAAAATPALASRTPASPPG